MFSAWHPALGCGKMRQSNDQLLWNTTMEKQGSLSDVRYIDLQSIGFINFAWRNLEEKSGKRNCS